MKKKIVAVILMLLSILPMQVFAAQQTAIITNPEGVVVKSISTVYEQEGMEYEWVYGKEDNQGFLPYGTEVKVHGEENGWLEIRYETIYGYVLPADVKMIEKEMTLWDKTKTFLASFPLSEEICPIPGELRSLFNILIILIGMLILLNIWHKISMRKRAKAFDEYFKKRYEELNEKYKKACEEYENAKKDSSIPLIVGIYESKKNEIIREARDLLDERNRAIKQSQKEETEWRKSLAKGIIAGDLIYKFVLTPSKGSPAQNAEEKRKKREEMDELIKKLQS